MQVPLRLTLQAHRDILPLGLLPLGLRVFDAFRSICCIKELGEGFGGVDFAPLSLSCRKLQLSPFEHCPLALHCQQSRRLLCSRFFTLWFLTTALVSQFPCLASKFPFRKSCSILILPSSSICDSQVRLFSDESPHCTIPIRYWVSQTLILLIRKNCPRCHQMGFVSSTIEFHPILYRTHEHCHFEQLKVWTMSSLDRTRRFQIIHWFKHLHLFDPQQSFRRKLWTSTHLNFESYLPSSECCWSREFVKVKFRDLQSFLVCSIILWESPLLRVEWISGWRSRLKSRIQGCVWNWTFTTCNGSPRTCEYKCLFRYVRNPRIEISWTRWRRRRSWICKKTFPEIPCEFHISGGWLLRLCNPPGSR